VTSIPGAALPNDPNRTGIQRGVQHSNTYRQTDTHTQQDDQQAHYYWLYAMSRVSPDHLHLFTPPPYTSNVPTRCSQSYVTWLYDVGLSRSL